MKRILIAAVALVPATLAFAPSAAGQAATDTPCVVTLPPGTYENVVVPPGATCTLTGATVRGNVRALENSRLSMLDNDVRGDVQGQRADTIEVGCPLGTGPCPGVQNSIDGDVDLYGTNGPRGVIVCAAVVGGNVEVRESRTASVNVGLLQGCSGNTIRGNIYAERNVASNWLTTSANDVRGDIYHLDNTIRTGGQPNYESALGNRVGGNLYVVGNSSSGQLLLQGNRLTTGNLEVERNAVATLLDTTSNTVPRNLQYTDNLAGSNHVAGNQVAKNLQFFKNTATQSNQVRNNGVGDTLSCFENRPPPLSGGNVAQKREGECPF